MIPLFKKLFTDETAGLRAIRAIIAILGLGIATNPEAFMGIPAWMGAILSGAAVFIGAGDKNPDLQKLIDAAVDKKVVNMQAQQRLSDVGKDG